MKNSKVHFVLVTVVSVVLFFCSGCMMAPPGAPYEQQQAVQNYNQGLVTGAVLGVAGGALLGTAISNHHRGVRYYRAPRYYRPYPRHYRTPRYWRH